MVFVPRLFRCAPIVLLASLCAQDPAGTTEAAFFAKWCVECHGGDTTKGKLDLTKLPDDPVERAWRSSRVRDRLRTREMPPADAEQPSNDERAARIAAIDAMLRAVVPTLAPDPGRVTTRRLSRTQWQNVVRDLFAVEVDTSAFPADDLGYGFDTVGDAVTFSTLHLEKFLAAARAVALAVFDGEDPRHPTVRRCEAESMQLVAGPGAGTEGDVANLYTNATIEQVVRLPRDGDYQFVLMAGADQAGDEPARMKLQIDGRDVETFDVDARRPREFERSVALSGGEHRVRIAFVNDFWDPKNPDAQRRDRNLRVDWLEVRGPTDVRPVPSARQWLLDALDGRGNDVARLRTFVRTLLPRVYRRPVVDAEIARIATVGETVLRSGQPLLVAARAALQAALVSPHFLFRIENDGGPLTSAALATRLSFFLWASAPDEALVRLAQSGRLAEPAVLATEIDRLLADRRAESLATDFAAQWLELRNLADRTPDPTRFPGFDGLRASMRRESELLFAAILRDNRDVRDLLDCDFTFVDAALATFYGLEVPVDARDFVRVELVGARRERGGILGHASVLALTSNPTRTSPVKRGKWILDNLLGQPPPPPPPGNDSLANEKQVDSARTFREQLAVHRERAECASCHVRMDTLGFALERYDAIGRHRESDAGGAIDSSGELPGGVRIDGLVDLKRVLRADPAFVHTVARKLFVYAVGRDLRPVDRLRIACRVDELLARDRVTLRDLVLVVASDEAFTRRAVR